MHRLTRRPGPTPASLYDRRLDEEASCSITFVPVSITWTLARTGRSRCTPQFPVAESTTTGTPRARRTLPQAVRRFLELFVLCGFAIAQPLLDITGRSPETFLFYRV